MKEVLIYLPFAIGLVAAVSGLVLCVWMCIPSKVNNKKQNDL